jgi:DNA-binding NarL/FixJ family response regulator
VDTIIVCDTEPVAIEGIRSLLENTEDLRLIAAETCLPEALAATLDLRPAILLLDKAFGFRAVIETVAELRHRGSMTMVAVWGTRISDAEALRFLQAGAFAVVRKTARLSVLLSCIRTVASGRTWVEDGILRDPDRPLFSRSALTAREMQVMELVELGMKNRDIAGTLGIQTGTVKIHLKHIFEKTGIRGRYGLALSGLKEKGLLATSNAPM